MLDRTFFSNGYQLRVTYNPETRIYKGRFMNDRSKPDIYGDTVNEVLELFDETVNDKNKEET